MSPFHPTRNPGRPAAGPARRRARGRDARGPSRLPRVRARDLAALAIGAVLALFALPGPGRCAPAPALSPLETRLIEAGFENVRVDSGAPLTIDYENRRYRQSAEAYGLVRRAAGAPVVGIERRFGLPVAAIQAVDSLGATVFHVRYPSDEDFPSAGAGGLRSPAFRRVDLDVGALLDYRVGRIFDPLELRLELQPSFRLHPWPGAAMQLGVLIPLVNDYQPGVLDQDAGRFRPGRMSGDQFFWIPGAALASVSAGYFGDNRWGGAVGFTRPFAEGAVLFDVQLERTGYLAFPDSGVVYSSPRATSGHVGITVRPGYADVAVRLRLSRYLYGDQGAELEVRRSMGDFDLAYFLLRSEGLNATGVRLDLPIPPMRRKAGVPLRIEPVSRFGFSFRDRSEAFGTEVTGIGSREDLLRQLSRASLEMNADLYEAARDARTRPPAGGEPEWVSMSGMTGFINTPWAGVLGDRQFEVGYNFVPRKWAYDHRGTNDNQVFYGTIGFLPRVETAMRWTRIPGYRSFQDIAPDSKLVDIDRMSSGRVEIVYPTTSHPGLAAGIEDVQGTRRFHSAYVVTGLPTSIFKVHCRFGLGYGVRAFEATRYVLDGAFGAIEIVPTRIARLQAEYDSEKWNLGVGLSPGAGFRIRAVLLNVESFGIGAGWSHAL